ncbi:MAG: peptide ABC transporter permease [Clostridiales bacterium]|nr:peptide ABC transporter permease [Clostridiales bacterium]
MVHYIIKRLGQSMLTILLIVCVVFLLLRLMPTDYFIPPDKIEKMTDQQKEDYLRPLGFLDNPFIQLGRFLYNAITRFDLGQSLRYNTSKTVAECIADTFGVSMSLGMISLGIALVVGVVLGILQARFKDGAFDRAGTGFTIFVNAVPALVSYSLIWAICTKVFGLPSQYNNKDIVRSCIGPILCLSLSSIASYMLWMRRYMVDELNKDYIRLAKLKGLSTTDVMFRHVMRNAFLPLAQYLPYNILLTVGGSLLMETFFAVPGMGDMLTKAIGKYDVNLVQALVMFYAALGILGLFLGDLLLTLLDPRISLTGKGETR